MALKILICVLCAAAVLGAAYLALGAVVFSQLLSKKAAGRGFNELADKDVLLGKDEALKKKREQQSLWERFLARVIGTSSGLEDFYDKPYFPSFYAGLQWFFANDRKKVTIQSPRGERLHADMFVNKNQSNIWFICLHGYMSAPRDFGGAAKVYHDDWGCNVLLPYLGGHGRSEGLVSMGWQDRIDVTAWINYLVREYDNPKIILHGCSMGGATTMMTTGENLPPNVVCAVADCGYTSVWDEYTVQAKSIFHLPPFPVLTALNTVVKHRLGFSLKDASCVEQVKKSKTPTLFVHGDADEFVPFWMLDKVYDACAAEKDKLVVHGAGHSEACYALDLYYGAIRKFAGQYLPELMAARNV